MERVGHVFRIEAGQLQRGIGDGHGRHDAGQRYRRPPSLGLDRLVGEGLFQVLAKSRHIHIDRERIGLKGAVLIPEHQGSKSSRLGRHHHLVRAGRIAVEYRRVVDIDPAQTGPGGHEHRTADGQMQRFAASRAGHTHRIVERRTLFSGARDGGDCRARSSRGLRVPRRGRQHQPERRACSRRESHRKLSVVCLVPRMVSTTYGRAGEGKVAARTTATLAGAGWKSWFRSTGCSSVCSRSAPLRSTK